jgi:hypothetical protein
MALAGLLLFNKTDYTETDLLDFSGWLTGLLPLGASPTPIAMEMATEFAERRNRTIRFFLIPYLSFTSSVLFSTSSGHFGISIGHIKKGDTMALFAGGGHHVVLRPQGNEWRYIGTARIHGPLKGESSPQKVNIDELQTFVLV